MARIQKLDVAKLPKQQDAGSLQCCLYVIREDESEHFKIGIANHIARRLSSLQGGNRRRLNVVLAYTGTRTHCLEVERTTLNAFNAVPGSEWVYAESVRQIERYMDCFQLEETNP